MIMISYKEKDEVSFEVSLQGLFLVFLPHLLHLHSYATLALAE
jgi:hypothetical protein